MLPITPTILTLTPRYVIFAPIPKHDLQRSAPGIVRCTATYDTTNLLPVSGGLFDESIFGAVDFAANRYDDPNVIVRGDRLTRFGRIVLAEPTAHPLLAGVLLTDLPVLPAGLRPVIVQDGEPRMTDLNRLYIEVLCHNNRIIQYRKLAIPSALEALLAEQAHLTKAISALMNNEALEDPVRNSSGEVLQSLVGSLGSSPAAVGALLDEHVSRGGNLHGRLPVQIHRIVATLWALGIIVMPKALDRDAL
ncbi:hypothetical protein LVJ94_17335 [Pendulispora rubella]|uniref:DNA-directed RNA polymerase n=2 Tax=Pendulispora rubella TaxID=2741070 RepID=A0ABZ2LJ06_9BACT